MGTRPNPISKNRADLISTNKNKTEKKQTKGNN